MTDIHTPFLRIKKLTHKQYKAVVKVAARHNLREAVAEKGAVKDSHIDPTKVNLNVVLRGLDTADGVAGMAQSLMDNAGIKSLRWDAVQALEVIFSLSPESPVDHARFFPDAIKWIEQYFDAPVISAVVHYDEAAPHCHVLVLPLVRGVMNGSRMMGSRPKLLALQADFYDKVGRLYGLARQEPQKRLSAAVRQLAAQRIMDVIDANRDAIRKPNVKQALVDAIAHSPEALLLALGLDIPELKEKRTVAGIMCKPMKPDQKQKPKMKPIGFEDVAAHEKVSKPILCRLPQSAAPIPPAASTTNAPLPPSQVTAGVAQEHDDIDERDDDGGDADFRAPRDGGPHRRFAHLTMSLDVFQDYG